ncbi:TetR/AcrR family transcriptional regulator [Segnochrobactrum spirostomi]|uniref:TetR family transcriptional regulator n=1 Tax=Segnochrobactrum spirostomi TaxID=2608987 RepID=A0A6A7Y7P7_9HYPH|nr:TetR/AcrR family transcriptional regulator [Segnochrobactrum spirostomi]MQT13529.1 TetR family transcriptional regulator [Segnochrobactrum spirostomi]
MPEVPTAPYHHGNARSALLAAAERLLNNGQISALSLRAIAETAGLSRQAPYNHFEGKADLLAELAKQGFERLTQELLAVAGTNDPRELLAKTGEVYLRFARESPALFQLMFSHDVVRLREHPSAFEASKGSYEVLKQAVARAVPQSQASERALAAWSMVHGYAVLEANGAVSNDDVTPPTNGGASGDNVVRLFADLIVGTKPGEDGDPPAGDV